MNRAVVVGIDRYGGAPLHGCVNDANDVADCLSDKGYDFDCVTLLDGQATRSGILQTVSAIAYGESGHTLVFYFAGHGHVIGNAGHLVTCDAQPYDPGVSLSHLAQIMESASSNFDHVISILDCCHSGSAFSWTDSRPLRSADIEREIPSVNESRCILAACRPEQSAVEQDGHGIFTDALTSALLGGAVDWEGQVTLHSVYDYVSKAIPVDTQTPVFKGDIAGTVILGRGFPPREGKPIESSKLGETLAKAHNLIDKYHYHQLSELSERGVRLQRGAKSCAETLEPIVKWFEDTEHALPDLRREPDWKSLIVRLREFRKNLADITIGEQTRFGRVVRHLGHGGYGHVWEVEGPGGINRAMKVFHGNELDDEVKVSRFRHGYENMRTLSHPRIVQVYDIVKAPYGFIMDAIAGENLRRAYIDREDPEIVLRLLLDICQTVQYAHAKSVKHRDIKPENIIAERGDNGELIPYLTDFDLAYHETNRTVTTNIGVGGVINYAAPEQLFEPNTKTARSETVDIYSLAQLMFFVITGRDPSGEKLMKNVEVLTKTLGNWVDDRAATLLIALYKKATSKPSERPQTVLEFMKEVNRAEAIISLASGTDYVSEEDFCRRVGFLYRGIGGYTDSDRACRMNSLSGQVEVVARLVDADGAQHANLEIECSVTGSLTIPALKSSKTGRESINVRLDKSLKRFPNATRHPGNKGTFQTYVYVRDVSLDVAGVSSVVEIVSTTVASIEQW
ncbi:caspase family protein [Nocardia sp. NPDC050712]|uniref:protein kinase domain-containing protein n=1 Tax=Nocardia sp. NPDC050712 TaxID=3155518 RepID=UPI0033FA8783